MQRSSGKKIIKKYDLAKNCMPQSYARIKGNLGNTGKNHSEGMFTFCGWPLKNDTYGGSFLYHMSNNQISIGYVIGLTIKTHLLVLIMNFKKFKTHPKIKKIISGGRRIALC